MLAFLDSARRYLWAFVELGFLALLAIILIYLLLGENSGAFVVSVAGNVTKFAGEVPTASLIGIGVILAIIYLVARQMEEASSRPRRPRARATEE
jgi:O-antigen ligase